MANCRSIKAKRRSFADFSIPSGLVGAAVVYYFGIRKSAKDRRFAFIERQLAEFYAPLAGLRKQIRAKSELRLKVFNATESALDSRYLTDEEDRRGTAVIDYHNKQFNEDIMPKYREMLGLFTDRYHLADADTRAFYPAFVEFVEIWNMSLAQSLTRGALKQLDHREENVKPLYEHIEAKMQHLQEEISQR